MSMPVLPTYHLCNLAKEYPATKYLDIYIRFHLVELSLLFKSAYLSISLSGPAPSKTRQKTVVFESSQRI